MNFVNKEQYNKDYNVNVQTMLKTLTESQGITEGKKSYVKLNPLLDRYIEFE